MKKLILFVTTFFTVSILFAAALPSLDGRAVVADSGELPKGFFARTVGYLPGDSVSVTNPATGSTVDVLILGSIDASEGVAILLSPEAAERLNIRKDSNVQVKITKRSGNPDESVSGTAVLAEDFTDSESDAEAEYEYVAESYAESLVAEESEEESLEEDTEEIAEKVSSEGESEASGVVEEKVVVVELSNPSEIAETESNVENPVSAEESNPVPGESIESSEVAYAIEADEDADLDKAAPVENTIEEKAAEEKCDDAELFTEEIFLNDEDKDHAEIVQLDEIDAEKPAPSDEVASELVPNEIENESERTVEEKIVLIEVDSPDEKEVKDAPESEPVEMAEVDAPEEHEELLSKSELFSEELPDDEKECAEDSSVSEEIFAEAAPVEDKNEVSETLIPLEERIIIVEAEPRYPEPKTEVIETEAFIEESDDDEVASEKFDAEIEKFESKEEETPRIEKVVIGEAPASDAAKIEEEEKGDDVAEEKFSLEDEYEKRTAPLEKIVIVETQPVEPPAAKAIESEKPEIESENPPVEVAENQPKVEDEKTEIESENPPLAAAENQPKIEEAKAPSSAPLPPAAPSKPLASSSSDEETLETKEEIALPPETSPALAEIPAAVEVEDEELEKTLPPAPAEEKLAELSSEEYKPIVLIPSPLNPPETEAKSESVAKETEAATAENLPPEIEAKSETLAKETESSGTEELALKTESLSEKEGEGESEDAKAADSSAPSSEIAPEKVEIAEAEAAEKEAAPEESLVTVKPSLKDLESGKYYVQIATLKTQDNIDAVVEKYGEKYPMVLVPLSSGSAYQVLIGPLAMSEYGAVTERFKSYGFKDCFLRKIR